MNKKKILKAAARMATSDVSIGRKLARKSAMTAGKWAMNRAMPARKESSTGSMLLKGLGAAAITLPLGYWLGRRLSA